MKFEASIGQKYRQKYSYMSREWMETMRVGRNTVESFNEELKQDRGTIVEPRRRRMRGLTALYFMTTVALAQVNIERIARFLKAEESDQAAEQRGKPRKPRITIRARDRFRKSGYFRGDRWRDDMTRSFDTADPPQRT
ncbi:hypothetical protein [Microcella alkaliphila]|uniref:hypothetical protein n=1 Tax=Microcella alkaliphila TaxID=279828 RepID=UPI00102885DF|nr:hypothetical protein [Microcella alkaliphila]